MEFVGTFWALVPPIIAITLALITTEAYSSLFIGVVIGALTPDGDLDLESMHRMMDCAGGLDVTLHRAFDMTRDPIRTMEDAIRLGCRTILTSGQQKDALTGVELLRQLQELSLIHI